MNNYDIVIAMQQHYKFKTHFSLSPSHLETRSADETEKKVELLASVATALAKKDLPVPGG